MNLFKKSLKAGKISKGNSKQQSYINASVFVGMLFLFLWTSIYKKTFIDVKIVLAIVFIPSFLAYLFLFKKYITICGYLHFIVKSTTYNILIRMLVFLLIAIPVGNFAALTFLYSNKIFAEKTCENITTIPKDIYESKLKGKRYTSYEISLDGTTKTLRSFEKSVAEMENSQLEFQIRTGSFGYRFYEKYEVTTRKENW